MGDFSWVQAILQLLFGQVGVLGTILIGFSVYLGWQLKLEQEAHAKTRAQKDELSEKRMVLLETFLKTQGEITLALHNLTEAVKRKRGVV